ncbi:MAG: SIS domain-containing protein [Opitutaceae bacterium]|nr:SIS domain-containing protein [Opitutaceae bacterium]
MTFDESLNESIQTFQALKEIEPQINNAGDLILEALRKGKKLLICGNGGSAAEAQHFATELTGRFQSNRRSLPAIALTGDGTLITCIANDFGADKVFSRQIEGLANEGDIIVCFSSSGQSSNIVTALQTAKELNLPSVSFLGKGGGLCKGLATVDLIVPGQQTAAVQESHLFLLHHICERIEEAFPAVE